jgi:hypothetical protein
MSQPNPLLDVGEVIVMHPRLRHPVTDQSNKPNPGIVVNALLKFRFASPHGVEAVDGMPARIPLLFSRPLDTVDSGSTQPELVPPDDFLGTPSAPSLRGAVSVSRLPPSFGDVALYHQIDKFLHKFCEELPFLFFLVVLGFSLTRHSCHSS